MNMKHKTKDLKLIPIIFSIGYIPLIVHYYMYNTGLAEFDWFPANSDAQVDFFLAWKAAAIVITGIIMTLIILYQRSKKRIVFKFENIFYLLLGYSLLVAMSALFSPYKHWVIFGIFELIEPVWVIFAYLIFCYYTYHVVRTETQLNSIICFSMIGVVIALLIGFFQAFGADFLQSYLGGMLMLNPGDWNHIKDIGFPFAGYVYMTLYNPDYIIFYVGIFLPIFIALAINAKKIVMKLFFIILCIASIICLIGSKALTGWISLFLAFMIALFVQLSRNRRKFAIGVVILLAAGIFSSILLCTSDSLHEFRDVILGTYKGCDAYGIKSIETDSDVCINYNGVKTHFSYDADSEQGSMSLYCMDDSGNQISQTINSDGTPVYTDSKRAEYEVEAIYIDKDLGIRISIENHQWVFAKLSDGTYYYFNAAGKFVKFPKDSTIELFNEDAVSGRGHIWNKTLPVLAKHILIGSGANTYLLEISQEDYLFKNYTDTNNNFDVKAHNWFLQQWVENGLAASLLLIVFFIWYAVSSIRIYRKVSFKKDIHRIGFAIFVGLFVYEISALANDPTVNVAPIYWCMIGLGLSVNRMITERESLSEHNQSSVE